MRPWKGVGKPWKLGESYKRASYRNCERVLKFNSKNDKKQRGGSIRDIILTKA